MAILSKVEVRIKSAGEPLTEYNDPDESELGDDSTTTKFIEATSGPKFSIEILLHNGYNFHGSDCVIVSRRMDGQTCCMHNIINKDDSRERVTQALKKSIGRDRIFDAESGQWKERSFTFARVEMMEHSELPDDLNLQKFVQLGAITITVRRGVRKLRRVPQAWSKVNGLSPVNQVSEKTLKGKAIENSIRYADQHIIPEPAARNYEHRHVTGSKGTPLVFNFLYRSHNALQIIGCIPRAPSPPIEIQEAQGPEIKPALAPHNRERIQAVLSKRAEERQRLQTELARLDRLDRADRGVKVEASQEENLDGTLRELSVLSNMKRERDNDGARIKSEGSASRKRPRASDPIQMVDLTGD